jgi:hypothetical protein
VGARVLVDHKVIGKYAGVVKEIQKDAVGTVVCIQHDRRRSRSFMRYARPADCRVIPPGDVTEIHWGVPPKPRRGLR